LVVSGLFAVSLVLLTLAGAPEAPVSAPAAPAASPRLEDAIVIEMTADKQEVYLGEAITVTLEYWELDFRGIKVQPLYRSTAVPLPDIEGFFAGPIREEHRQATRGGALYNVTAYRLELFPAMAGSLQVGAWRWQGTVRGHTASGARAMPVDLSTSPIGIQVRPLPDPPSTFKGAVGEIGLRLFFESTDLQQGVPGKIVVEFTGTGHVQALQPPILPEESWFDIGDPVEEPLAFAPEDRSPPVKRFVYPFMPLQGGEDSFPPASYTYFSPAEGRYKVIRTEPIPLRIRPAGAAEKLVVVGGGNAGPAGRLNVVGEGRLPIVAEIPDFRTRRDRWELLAARDPAAASHVSPGMVFLRWNGAPAETGSRTEAGNARRCAPGGGTRRSVPLRCAKPRRAVDPGTTHRPHGHRLDRTRNSGATCRR
jgi:hypothetical protein